MDELDVFIVTYNRAAALRRTLDALLASPFAGCTVTVLDNASTDDTPGVCDEFAGRFERLRTVRHARNVGFGANYLRAVELARAPYTWILADDDDYDFSDVGDVLERVRAGEVDAISVGAPGREPWPTGVETTVGRMIAAGQRFYFVFSFLPNTIFRTATFDSPTLVAGYAHIRHLYPQFALLARLERDDARVYVSRSTIVSRRGLDPRPSQMYWVHGWIASCDDLPEPAMRKRAIYELAHSRVGWVLILAVQTALEREHHPERLPRVLADLTVMLRGEQRAILPVLYALALLPPSAVHALRRVLRRPVVPPPASADFDALRSDAPARHRAAA